ncbi:YjjG family noncanonical pyrimidine nucleotidase [Spirobacillus cienkowskii]|jgi:2-haloacid dehalogenase|uniref:Noncanonical pyrimidine nucleotidase, YjjG family n=1 Tax=Spirobacillus cienkowskii TaxID=495820 RepID=A0A369KYT2_9BACT|nr:MAG: noncanonical pyrimidine nucleotidase, YjjG family [Spirobacillus cienkowskii]
MKYSLIFFDADDTLFDFTKSQEIAFKNAVAHFKINFHIDILYSDYKKINKELWNNLEQGHVSLESLRVLRFKKIFEKHSIPQDPSKFDEYYMQKISQSTTLLPNALEICKFLKSAGINIGIITNGFSEVQKKRIRESEISEFIDSIIVSEEVGVRKPQPQIFEIALNQFQHIPKNKVLMVGDNLNADILGANRAGIDSCWFHKHGGAPKMDIQPKYTINELIQLKKLVY